MSRNEWIVRCCVIISVCLLLLAVFFGSAFFIFNDMKNKYIELNDSYKTQKAIVEQKNLKIDELNAQIEQLKEVK